MKYQVKKEIRHWFSTLIFIILFFLPQAYAAEELGTKRGIFLPFDTGQTWYVCQGYNTPNPSPEVDASHNNDNGEDPDFTYSLDFSLRADSPSDGGLCSTGTDTGVSDEYIFAPGDGVIDGFRNGDFGDAVCLSLDSGGSLWLGHFKPYVEEKQRVKAYQVLGKFNVGDKGNGNNGYAHIHISAYTSSNCTSGNAPLENFVINGKNYNFKLFGVPNLSDLEQAKKQYHGMAINSSFISNNSVIESDHDAGQNPLVGCDANSNHNENYFGFCADGTPITSGFHFKTPQLPPSMDINSARLLLAVDGPGYTPLKLEIKAHKSNTSNDFSNQMPHQYTPLTTHSAQWNLVGQLPWHLGDTWESPDLKHITQELVDAIGWSNTSPLTLIVNTLGELGNNGGEFGRSRRVVASDREDIIIRGKKISYNKIRPARLVVTSLPNKPPKAIAKAYYKEAKRVKRLLLSGAKSFDPDGKVKTYLWKQVSGEPLILSRPNQKNVRVKFPPAYSGDVVTFRLTVTDDSIYKAQDSALVTVCIEVSACS
ncbi:PKD domain-containing protein [Aliikangiella sp. IMCC44359]|uniref:PKD domain-containing protein n=1 Tax=Aliikangiella sp. IMCC44359 TaxID=3459125 RepID=UPI00403B3699